jgi:valyl-tRNA synthetase
MDPAYVRAVQETFVRYFEKGYIYRGNRIVNWCPRCASAISDLEVDHKDTDDTLTWIRYPLAEGSGHLTIATVRPPTMLADVAVAVHPEDARYADLVGREAIVPIVNRRVPIIADERVEPEFGTGALKVTPGHDPNDFEIGRAHGLDEIVVIGEDGRMNEAAGERFAGMRPLEARAAIVSALREQGAITHAEQYKHDVPYSHRSGERIEPLISLQWFMRMDELAAPAIEVVESGRIQIHPETQRRRYVEWMENIRPWCISRQLWWGHQIPVWYRGDETHVGMEPPTGDGWERDPDVLDTWFSSGIWPFVTLGWPEQTAALRAFYPTDVLSTARDILFLWVARMVMFGLEFADDIPFDDVYVHPVIQAPDGRRMSKSLGTGIDPLDLIEQHGGDALRFGLLAMSSAQDVRFNEGKVQQGRDLANKLWNASRLILLRVSSEATPDPGAAGALEDRWIVSRLERLTERATELYDGFRFSHAALDLYGAFWSELCDWYLELVKPRLYEEDNREVSGVLLWALERTLKLLHPVMPFVTEEIWSLMPGERRLLATSDWPEADESRFDPEAEAEVGRLIEAVTSLRRYRDEVGAKGSAPVRGRLVAEGYEGLEDQLARLARFEFVGDASGNGDVLATVPIPGGGVQILPSDAFDPAEAEKRITARREQLRAEIERAEHKLANEKFVERAPAEVVEEERRKLEEYREALRRLGD